jgi:imidazole glycerol-phosphate synthase subunit HisH
MSKYQIGIIDYDSGNHNSIRQTVLDLGYKCFVGRESEKLSPCDLLILPGVGAFPHARKALGHYGMDSFLKEHVSHGKPLIGICLGLQLLAQTSEENGNTVGLGFFDGNIVPIPSNFHIGWNHLKATEQANRFRQYGEGIDFYFNHSFHYDGPDEDILFSTVSARHSITAAIRKDLIVGFQFHPEKSQEAGRLLLKAAIEELIHG